MKDEEAFIQFRIRRDQHRKLFRWLDKNTPGWRLTLRPENNLYQHIYDSEDIKDIEEPQDLEDFLRNKTWSSNSAHLRCYPVILTTKKYGTIMRMFWPEIRKMENGTRDTAEIHCKVYRLPSPDVRRFPKDVMLADEL